MKLILIEWVDSHGCTPSWTSLENYRAVLPIMKSVGWLVFEDENLYSVCGNISEETESTVFQGNGIMTIPKKAVLSLIELSS